MHLLFTLNLLIIYANAMTSTHNGTHHKVNETIRHGDLYNLIKQKEDINADIEKLQLVTNH